MAAVTVIRASACPPTTRGFPEPPIQRLVDDSSGAKDLTVLRNELAPGNRVKPHMHDVEEALLVVAGSIIVYADGTAPHDVTSGDLVIVPSQCRHWFEAHGPRASVIAVLASANASTDYGD